jgi:seryl-tRNA synthetase
MLDIRFIRDNAEAVQTNARNKGYQVDINALLKVDAERRELQAQADELRAKRNDNIARTKGVRPTEELITESKLIKEQIITIEAKLKDIDVDYTILLKKVPNMAASDVPIGGSEDENVVAKIVGDLPKFDFSPRNHAEIAIERGWLDKERAAKVAGSRFAYIKGDLARLSRAMVDYALDVLNDEATLKKIAEGAGLKVSSKPFVPVLPPLLIKTEAYDAMDRLEPRDDRYKLEGEELWLQGSAEHVLGSMHANEIIPESELPIRYAGFATSFRKEAGTYGKDMEGIFRMHQFDKLEMESLTTSENSLNEHLFLIAIQEYLMSQLGLPYRVIMKCTFDIGKPNARGVDIDVWLPGQDKYRETHTADYMTDYQARRLNMRVRRQSGEVELLHTNDATGLSQRPLIAIIENYQMADGRIKVPTVLQSYLAGRDIL